MPGEFLCGSNCFAKPAIYHGFKMENALLGVGNLRVERLLSRGKLHAGEGHTLRPHHKKATQTEA